MRRNVLFVNVVLKDVQSTALSTLGKIWRKMRNICFDQIPAAQSPCRKMVQICTTLLWLFALAFAVIFKLARTTLRVGGFEDTRSFKHDVPFEGLHSDHQLK